MPTTINLFDINCSFSSVDLNGAKISPTDIPFQINPSNYAGNSYYISAISGAYVIGGVNNPTLSVVRGATYIFNLNAAGHPFWLQTVIGAYNVNNVYTAGVTNAGAQTGVITWTVPDNAPNTLYYVCQNHGNMNGLINVTSIDTPQWLGSNCLTEIKSTEFFSKLRFVLHASPLNNSSVSIFLDDFILSPDDNNRAISFNAKLKCASPINISINILRDGLSNTEIITNSEISSGEYAAIHSGVINIPDDNATHSISIVISITGHESNPIFFTYPNLIYDENFHQNPFVGLMRNFFPDFYWQIDEEQQAPTYPFFKLVDALTHAAGDTNIMRTRMQFFENTELVDMNEQTEYWARSVLTTPDLAGSTYGPWLSQFTGEGIRKNIQFKNGDFYFDNDSIIHEFVVWQLSNSYFGRAAGSKEAIKSSIKQVLQKTKNGNLSTRSVTLSTRYLGNPYQIRVQTLANETLDASAGEESHLVLTIANLARPMGYLISHNTVTIFQFTIDDESLGVIGEFALA